MGCADCSGSAEAEGIVNMTDYDRLGGFVAYARAAGAAGPAESIAAAERAVGLFGEDVDGAMRWLDEHAASA